MYFDNPFQKGLTSKALTDMGQAIYESKILSVRRENKGIRAYSKPMKILI